MRGTRGSWHRSGRRGDANARSPNHPALARPTRTRGRDKSPLRRSPRGTSRSLPLREELVTQPSASARFIPLVPADRGGHRRSTPRARTRYLSFAPIREHGQWLRDQVAAALPGLPADLLPGLRRPDLHGHSRRDLRERPDLEFLFGTWVRGSPPRWSWLTLPARWGSISSSGPRSGLRLLERRGKVQVGGDPHARGACAKNGLLVPVRP